jgi:hypothetical protein
MCAGDLGSAEDLLADVEVVANYKFAEINRTKLENLIKK